MTYSRKNGNINKLSRTVAVKLHKMVAIRALKKLIKKFIELFTDPGEVVIDPCAGSAVVLRAAAELGRRAYGFEIKKEYVKLANEKILTNIQPELIF